jgi:hypothetical protein
MKLRMLVRCASWAGVVFIASLAFWVSYHAIKGVWITSGAGRPQDAWAIPLLIDGLIVVGSLVGLTRALDGVRGGWVSAHPWTLVLAATMVSLVANIAHATPSLGAQAMASLIPLILFAATELVIGEFRRTSKSARSTPGPDPAVEVTDGIAPVPVPRGDTPTGSVHPYRGGRLPAAPGVGVGGVAVERATAGVGDTLAARPLGDVEGGRGPGGAGVGGVRADELAHGRDRAKSIDAVVMRILDARGQRAHDVKRGDIIDEVTRELGPVTIGSVGNALGRLRAIENASSNGGMRVR